MLVEERMLASSEIDRLLRELRLLMAEMRRIIAEHRALANG